MTRSKSGLYAALSIALFIPAASASAATPSLAGVFGNVYYNQPIDDLRGQEIEIRGTGPNPTTEFITCPGDCLDIHKVDATVTGNKIAFEYAEPSATPDGAPKVRKFVGTLKGDKMTMVEVSAPGSKPQVLLRRPERYGLDIAVEAHTDHGH